MKKMAGGRPGWKRTGVEEAVAAEADATQNRKRARNKKKVLQQN